MMKPSTPPDDHRAAAEVPRDSGHPRGTWPKNNAAWWEAKLLTNRARDRDTDAKLRAAGGGGARLGARACCASSGMRGGAGLSSTSNA